MKEAFYEPLGLAYQQNEHQPGWKTLVFIHGLSGSSSAWEPYLRFFSLYANVLALDLRGHGRSRKPPHYDDYQIGLFASDIFELLGQLGIENFILVSHSLGSLVALEFLKNHQTMVERAILLSPHPAPSQLLPAKLIQPALALLPFLNRWPIPPTPASRVKYAPYEGSGDWNIPRMIADISQTSLRAYLYATRQSYAVDYTDFLDQIRIPTLIIHGAKDSIFPVSASRSMAMKIKKAELLELGRADHILVLNHYERVRDEIMAFSGLLSDGAFLQK
jgi:pimeloyl-ACP methyl ester carboxylesterase